MTDYCHGCERTIRLRKDGTFQAHNVRTLSIRCPGSGLTPKEARERDLWNLNVPKKEITMTGFEFSVHDAASGVTYRPWTDGHAVGYQVGWPDGSLTYIYLNASGGSDDGVPNVFVYEGNAGDPRQDPPVHHYDLDWPESQAGVERAALKEVRPVTDTSRSDAMRTSPPCTEHSVAGHRPASSSSSIFEGEAP